MWNIIKAITRITIRVVLETINRVTINILDTLFGFLTWPEKKIRIQVVILVDHDQQPIVPPKDIDHAIEYARQVFKKYFNVKLLPVNNKQIVDVVKQNAPQEVLYTKGGAGALSEEFKVAGSFFASNLIGIIYPVTVFVVKDIRGASGCSLGPISDYVTLDPDGAKNSSILAHEIAHACGLWHVKQRSNLLCPYNDRGDKVNWWQKNVFRSSRHVTYW
jgi:hypothetical protein